jgi:tetratricopeptide (TPR) repeat protein
VKTARRLALLIAAACTVFAWTSSVRAQSQATPQRAAPDPVARAYADLGKELYYASEYDEAAASLQKALARAPDNGEARLFLALTFTEKKSYGAAEQNFLKLLDDPKVAKDRVHAGLGYIYSAQNELKKAETEYRKAQGLSPKSPRYANNLAYVLAQQGRNLEEGLRLIDMALESTPASPSIGTLDPIRGYYLDTRALLYYKLRKYGEAEKDQLEAIKLAEKFSLSQVASRRYLLGRIYASTQRRDLAKREFEKAVKLDSTFKQAAEALKNL